MTQGNNGVGVNGINVDLDDSYQKDFFQDWLGGVDGINVDLDDAYQKDFFQDWLGGVDGESMMFIPGERD